MYIYIIIIYIIYVYIYGAYWSYDFPDHTIASASFRLVGDGSTHLLRKQCEVWMEKKRRPTIQ